MGYVGYGDDGWKVESEMGYWVGGGRSYLAVHHLDQRVRSARGSEVWFWVFGWKDQWQLTLLMILSSSAPGIIMSLNNVQIKLFTLSLRSALPHSGICPVEIVTIDMRCYISEVPVKNVDKQIGRKPCKAG